MVHNLDADWLTNGLTHTHTRTHTTRVPMATNGLIHKQLGCRLAHQRTYTHNSDAANQRTYTHHLDADGSPADVYTQLVCRWFPMGLTLFTKADFT